MNIISVTLQSIVCHGTSENSDEIYVVYQADAGLPRRIPRGSLAHHDISAGQTWTLNETITYTRDLLITIYDQDPSKLPTLSDYLVSVDYTPTSIPPAANRTNYNGANYTINVAVNA